MIAVNDTFRKCRLIPVTHYESGTCVAEGNSR
jgi:hypothetical protein